ncbi:MAG: hypothetical protein KF729_27450 [Sandaracinaceae bacterium]|nr:hypothetical protein [Sandaracinaceae bacterium]
MSGAGREVHVLVPCDAEGRSPEFDTPAHRAELASWFAPLGLRWRWVPVRIGEADAIAAALAGRDDAVAFNLCDGDELDGYPGLSVVEALERRGVPFTGADAAFYRTSSSKLAMKRAFARAGVATPPFAEPIGELDALVASVGLPCLVKLDTGAAGLGLGRASVATARAELEAALALPRAGARGAFVEAFAPGDELTVLVVGDARAADALAALTSYPAVAMDFAPGTPATERILFHGHRLEPSPHAPGVPHCRYRLAAPDASRAAEALARRAFVATAGRGYARVDLRDGPRGLEVLEVNANCALSIDEPTIGLALAARGEAMSDLARAILRVALDGGSA